MIILLSPKIQYPHTTFALRIHFRILKAFNFEIWLPEHGIHAVCTRVIIAQFASSQVFCQCGFSSIAVSDQDQLNVPVDVPLKFLTFFQVLPVS